MQDNCADSIEQPRRHAHKLCLNGSAHGEAQVAMNELRLMAWPVPQLASRNSNAYRSCRRRRNGNRRQRHPPQTPAHYRTRAKL
jgi:hypothetical protein